MNLNAGWPVGRVITRGVGTVLPGQQARGVGGEPGLHVRDEEEPDPGSGSQQCELPMPPAPEEDRGPRILNVRTSDRSVTNFHEGPLPLHEKRADRRMMGRIHKTQRPWSLRSQCFGSPGN